MTGATGFVGSHLVEALVHRGVTVRAVVRPTSDVAGLPRRGVERVDGGLDPGALERAVAGADVVYHLAAATRVVRRSDFEASNVRGTRAVVAACLAATPRPRRLVYLSSLAAVGPAWDGRPVTRDTPPRPLTAYGRSKLAGEAACLEAADRLDITVLRAPAVYGPRERDLLAFFRFAAAGFLPVPTGPARLVQMVHVSDLVDALCLAGTVEGAVGLFHIAEPRAYAWREIATMVAEAVGRPARVLPVPGVLFAAAGACTGLWGRLTKRPLVFDRDKVRELLAPGWLCETDAAQRALGFLAAIPLARGLAETADWYRAAGLLGVGAMRKPLAESR